MSQRTETFPVGPAPRLEVRIGSGHVRLVAGEEGRVEVTAQGRAVDELVIEGRGDTVVVEQVGRRLSRSVRIIASVPASIDVEMKLGSADLVVETPISELRAATGAGDVRAGDVAGSVHVATGAGDVTLGSVAGRLEVSLASGDLEVAAVGGDFDAKTAAGDIRTGRVGGRLAARTASGDLDIGRFEGPDLTAQSMSGDVRIGIPPGRTLEVDISTLAGSVRNEFGMSEQGDDVTATAALRVKTLAGDIVLHAASAA